MLKNVCFTLNNYTNTDIDLLKKNKLINYCVIGKEVAPTTNTPHLQGYAELCGQRKMKTLKKEFGEKYHFENRLGTQDQAIAYCKKGLNFEEWGIKHEQGTRKDIPEIRVLAKEQGLRAVAKVGNLQQIRIAEKYLTYNEEPRDWQPYVMWFWGTTGVGKSRRARELGANKDDVYTKNDGTKWWDGYDAHGCVIIDDFRDSWWTITEMLSLLDRYEKRVEYKGGWRQFKPRMIIVTSCSAPQDCYKNTGEAINQLLRRINVTEEVKPPADTHSEVGEVILELPS